MDAFTLIELVIVMTIIGVLAAIAMPKFNGVVEKARVAKAIGDIKAIEIEILSLDSLPTSLAAIGRHTFTDPWGNPYVYAKLEGTRGNGGARKDRFLVPLNSDFDLYSKGKDGDSAAPLSARSSKDDILRANDGGFVGLGSAY